MTYNVLMWTLNPTDSLTHIAVWESCLTGSTDPTESCSGGIVDRMNTETPADEFE